MPRARGRCAVPPRRVAEPANAVAAAVGRAGMYLEFGEK